MIRIVRLFSNARRLTWIILIAIIVVADLGTKWLATIIGRNDDVGLIAPRLNPEFALGVLSTDKHPLVTSLLVTIALSMLVHAFTLTRRGQLARWTTASLVAGAIANLLDRAVTGAVHDWLNLGVVIANLADFALLFGLIAYLRAAWSAADKRAQTPRPVTV